MPKLNEYLGGIVSEIISARRMADLQTLQIAKEYAQDDLLKHFSIPRMKIGNVDLTIPFATGGKSIKNFNEFTYDEIVKTAGTDYDASDTKNDQNLKSVLLNMEADYNNALLKIRAENITVFTDAEYHYFKNMPEKIIDFCKSLPNFKWQKTDPQFLSERVYARILDEAKKNIEKTEDYGIIVEADKLMALDAKCLIYAKMTVSEAGMEWSRYEDINGNPVETLIPE
ncbi:hypothetical protein [Chryseobacterium sp. H1D6B]|uniref:hypothetical protein n=1 Tax=Chryseobacterium sp. H1D6B TaxID=2940588 RepID=UPI0015C98618|nr:hypothetical protein [Chryseobacterium sp. H1D6B]